MSDKMTSFAGPEITDEQAKALYRVELKTTLEQIERMEWSKADYSELVVKLTYWLPKLVAFVIMLFFRQVRETAAMRIEIDQLKKTVAELTTSTKDG